MVGILVQKGSSSLELFQVGFLSFEKREAFGEKNKMESIYCLMFEGPKDAFFFLKIIITPSKDLDLSLWML